MQQIFSKITRDVYVDGKLVDIGAFINQAISSNTPFTFTLPKQVPKKISIVDEILEGKTYLISVRKYMLDKACSFNLKWNPEAIPMRTMKCKILEQRRGIYRVAATATPVDTSTCIVCGRTITTKESLLCGIGPECRKRLNISVDDKEDDITTQLKTINWEGWLPAQGIVTFKYMEDKLNGEDTG